MGRPKKTDEAPKRRGRPPKNPDKKAEKKTAKKGGRGGRRGKKPADSSTFTFRIDNRLRTELKKRAPKEYTSESSLCNRFIALGLQVGTFQRLASILTTLSEKAGIELDPAIQAIAEDLDREPVEETDDEEPEGDVTGPPDDNIEDDGDDNSEPEVVASSDDEDVDLDDGDEEEEEEEGSDEQLAAASNEVSAAKASGADDDEKQLTAGKPA